MPKKRGGLSPYSNIANVHVAFRDVLATWGPQVGLRTIGNLISDAEKEMYRRRISKMHYRSRDLAKAQALLWDSAEGLHE